MHGDMAQSALTMLVVTAQTQAGLDGALARLVRDGGASAAMVVERSGLLLASTGEGRAATEAVGALTAGIFKSLKTLSGLLDENAIRTLRQVGPHTVTLMALLDTDDLLLASFPSDLPESRPGGAMEIAATEVSRLMAAARQEKGPLPPLLDPSAIDDILGNF